MTKAELIAENERLKKELKEIYELTTLASMPNDEYEKEYYDKGDFSALCAYRIGTIRAEVKNALDPDWMDHTREETEAIIASL